MLFNVKSIKSPHNTSLRNSAALQPDIDQRLMNNFHVKKCSYFTEIKCIFCNATVKMKIKSIYNRDSRYLKME